MSMQVPSPDKILSGLVSFPPKLSTAIEPLTYPENQLQQMAQASGLQLPVGPANMLYNVAKGFEGSTSQMQLPQLPQLPAIQAPAVQAPVSQQAQPVSQVVSKYEVI